MECPVCYTSEMEPKRLYCGHTICVDCCKGIQGDDRHKLQCPMCKALITLPGDNVNNLPTNLLHQKIQNVYKDYDKTSSDEYVKCQVCGQNTGMNDLRKCWDCQIQMCHVCTAVHKEKPVLRNHVIDRINVLGCKNHGMECTYFCVQCERFLCVACISYDGICADHEDEVKNLRDLKTLIEPELIEFLENPNARPTGQEVINAMGQIEQRLREAEQIKESIHSNAENLIEEIRKQEEELVENVTKWEKPIRELKQRLESLSQDMPNIEELQKSVQEGLHSIIENLIITFSLLKSISVQPSELKILDEADIFFIPGESVNLGNVQTNYSNISQPLPCLQESFESDTSDLTETLSQRWHVTIQGLQDATDVTFTPNGHIVAVDCYDNNVLLFNGEGDLISSTQDKGVAFEGSLWQVACDSKTPTVIVTHGSNSLVFLRDDDLSFIKRIRLKGKGVAESVSVLSDGRFVVGTKRPYSVSIYSRKGKLQKCISSYDDSGTQKNIYPSYISIMRGDNILVSSFVDNNIVFLSPRLQQLDIVKVNCPTGFAISPRDEILVAGGEHESSYEYISGDVYQLASTTNDLQPRSILRITQEQAEEYGCLQSIASNNDKLAALFEHGICLYEWM